MKLNLWESILQNKKSFDRIRVEQNEGEDVENSNQKQ
jgi:hypothetical protein